MLCVRRDEDVSPDVHSGTRTLFEGDDRQPVQEVIEYLLALGGGLLGDPVPYFCRRREDTAVVADLCEAARSADGGGGAKSSDTRAAAVCRWPCIWMPGFARLLCPHPTCSCPCCVSLASQPTLDRRTSGSAAIARLSPCHDGLPVLP